MTKFCWGYYWGMERNLRNYLPVHQIERLEYYFLRKDVYCENYPNVPDKCESFPVVFMGNPQSREVQTLMSTYEKELEIFAKMYQKKDPVILFLEGICEEEGDLLQGPFIHCSIPIA